ncbi:MAG: methyltransferase domain-containing protein [Roseiflexaceae bacterium]
MYPLVGFDMERYRQDTIAALGLSRGDTVVELGCGTGLNFGYVQRAIGPEGTIIGVDLTDSMLDVARTRVAREGWANVELIQADVAQWQYRSEIAGVYSTLALTLVAEYDMVIQRASQALKPGGRFAILDMKEPINWPFWAIRLAAWMNRPFGVSLDLAERHPWESVRRYLIETQYREYYFGALYLCAGQKAGAEPGPGGAG